jgi:glyoxylase-like metal-dependent hydrolase (beta-lactamase superfamily II)
MMLWRHFLPELLDTGAVCQEVLAVRDGLVNFYVVRGPSGLLCIDTGWRATQVVRAFTALGLNVGDVAAVFLTHLHWDHARCHALYRNARVYVGAQEVPGAFVVSHGRIVQPWVRVRDGEMVSAAGLRVRVMGTPGHTAGSVSYVVDDRLLFTGDALRLLRGEVVPFWPRLIGDRKGMAGSIQRLARLENVERLLTAHTGATTDVAVAFRRWRTPADKLPLQEGLRP